MRIVSWNIMHGGGQRADRIIEQLRRWEPDVVGLSEFRGTEPSQRIAAALAEMGLSHQFSTVDRESLSRNSLLLASRFPCQRHPGEGPLEGIGRWIHVEMARPFPLHVIAMHVPNRDEGDKYGCHRWVVDYFARHAASPAIAMGDTNSGVAGIDEEAKYFNKHETAWFDQIKQTSWRDLWRHRNPSERQYTWRTHAGNGFRIDQLFATETIEPRISRLEHDWCEQASSKLSDHAAIVTEIESS